MRVTIIGMGRLGRSLLPLLREAGHEAQPCGREGSPPAADVYWLTTPDSQLRAAASRVPLGAAVLHASGAADWELLRPHRPAGSLHPLQSFPGPEVSLPILDGVPAAVAGDPAAKAIAEELARSLGMRPVEVPGDRRLYHAAAVMAGNFSTILLSIGAQLLEAAGVHHEDAERMLIPLARASIEQCSTRGAREALTGPIARGDERTIAQHLEAMDENFPDITSIYRLLSRRGAMLLEEGGEISTEQLESLIRILK